MGGDDFSGFPLGKAFNHLDTKMVVARKEVRQEGRLRLGIYPKPPKVIFHYKDSGGCIREIAMTLESAKELFC